LEPPLCVVSSWVIIRVYTILVWNTISGSSNLDNCCYHYLILISISHLKALFIIIVVVVVIVVVVNYNLYNKPPCGSTPVLPGYLLLRHSCTWEKTSIFWSCQLTYKLDGWLLLNITFSTVQLRAKWPGLPQLKQFIFLPFLPPCFPQLGLCPLTLPCLCLEPYAPRILVLDMKAHLQASQREVDFLQAQHDEQHHQISWCCHCG